jgi:hypothetical protein
LYFGYVEAMEVDDVTGIITRTPDDYVQANAQLIIDAQSGGQVRIIDPIHVDQVTTTKGGSFDGTFAMEVWGNGGEFWWDGDNVFEVADTYDPLIHGQTDNTVSLRSGSITELMKGMTLKAVNHHFMLDDGGFLRINGWDDVVKNQTNTLWVPNAEFHGEMNFVLNGPDVSGLCPSGGGGPNCKANRVLLKVYRDPDIPTSPANTVDVTNALITLTDFYYGSELTPNVNQFFLIDAGEDQFGDDNPIVGTPRNDRASSKRSNLTNYEFIIDFNDLDGGQLSSNRRYLVARLAGVKINPQTIILTESFATGAVFMAQTSTWLPDHSYQQADMAIQGEDAWQVFAGFDVSKFSLDAFEDFDIVAGTFLAGVGKKFTGDMGKLLFGAYVEGGYGKYDIGEIVEEIDTTFTVLKGDGELRYIGLGLMARETFDNNFRLEASVRGGIMENEFSSTSHNSAVSTDSGRTGYKLRTPYVAAHLGLAYMYDINDFSSLDFVLRGYWSRLMGKTVHEYEGEALTFSDTDSFRARAGLRYTNLTPNDTYWYVGGYYDYEFDQKFSARVDKDNLHLDVPDLKGGTGIFEIGLISHPTSNKNFSLEFGFQGYVGEIEGLSGGIRLGYEF